MYDMNSRSHSVLLPDLGSLFHWIKRSVKFFKQFLTLVLIAPFERSRQNDIAELTGGEGLYSCACTAQKVTVKLTQRGKSPLK